MNQPKLWHEDVYDALGADAQAIGKKKLGLMLWGDMTPQAAGEKVNRCLNPEHAQNFSPQQVQFIIAEARKVGSYATIYYFCEDGHFTKPEPIEPEDQVAKLQREYIEAAKSMEQIAKDIKRLST